MTSGLPPLARGAHDVSQQITGESRPTPAGAGSTSAGSTAPALIAAYPRWRGEHVWPSHASVA